MGFRNNLQRIVEDDLLLEVFLLGLLDLLLQGLGGELYAGEFCNLDGVNLIIHNLHPEFIVVVIPERSLKLSVLATVVFALPHKGK